MAPFYSSAPLISAVFVAHFVSCAFAGYAPKDAPKLPEGFCPPETGAVTATTGGHMATLMTSWFLDYIATANDIFI
ncbi:hypothetical protein ACHAWF_014685 [Thalassiosira exigua]